MLIALNIKNFALIQELSIEFGAGFNILSGETGAGKSILIDSIDYVLGGKFSKNLIRYGESKTFVEAIFSIENSDLKDLLEDLNIEYDEQIIISRETTISSKSIIKVNGKSIILVQLKKIREKLLNMHGQHQNQSLLNKSNHILHLDEFCFKDISQYLSQFDELRTNYLEILSKINKINKNSDKEKIIDYLKFQIEDIEKANLKVSEEEELKERFNILSNSEKISLALNKSYGYLNGNLEGINVLDGLSKVLTQFSYVSDHFDKIKEKNIQIEEILFVLQEVARDIKDISDEIVYDEGELATINERLYDISLYKKKYGKSIEDILKNLENMKTEYNELLDSEKILDKLNCELQISKDKLKQLGLKIHNIRVESAKILEEKIKNELKYVGLEKAIIKIDIIFSDNLNYKGYDEVQFLVSANPGEPLRELEKVLSGGELSRIMLALKCVFVDKEKISTLIFDEIDTGISGNIAKRVGEKMYEVSTKHQVLCITHLPQIASLSDNHYFVSKKVKNNKTFTEVKILTKEEKVNDIAKMIGGDDVTKISLNNASEMIKLAKYKKSEIINT